MNWSSVQPRGNVQAAVGVALFFHLAPIWAAESRGKAPSYASSPNEVVQPGEVASDDDTHLEHATPDPTPQVPIVLQRRHTKPVVDVIEQVGVGGLVAFGSAGVFEVGGSGALLASRDYVMAKFAPTVGLFIYDGIELSYVHEVYGGTATPGTAVTTFAVIDLTVHLRINDRLLGFFGAGPGLSYNGETCGLGGKSRVGLDVLIGRSGLFRPAAFFAATSNTLVDLRGSSTDSEWQSGLEFSYSALF